MTLHIGDTPAAPEASDAPDDHRIRDILLATAAAVVVLALFWGMSLLLWRLLTH